MVRDPAPSSCGKMLDSGVMVPLSKIERETEREIEIEAVPKARTVDRERRRVVVVESARASARSIVVVASHRTAFCRVRCLALVLALVLVLLLVLLRVRVDAEIFLAARMDSCTSCPLCFSESAPLSARARTRAVRSIMEDRQLDGIGWNESDWMGWDMGWDGVYN
eukprot:CAMPEP_0172383656 /NCGR_PEP_ID=MMETSP1061-20121228/1520_1 /TAXON_ID=37318 /ORGANISM="Pseudo-nitzschia pungens, Strain cf. pungens" /LENGTH=165 /DNA_ID=CAMNT_0013111979 /DNA_START=99 /DNA_END=597 /DNA_ORIENTATION=+